MRNQPSSPLTPMTPIKKKKALERKLKKLLKQQEHYQEEKQYLPGKLDIVSSQRCKARVVNFFGDVHTEVFCLGVSCDDELVAAGCSNGDVKVYNIYESKLLMMGNTSRLSGYPNTSVRWHPKNRNELTACNCDGTIKWYNTQKQIAIGHHESSDGYLCADYGCDGNWSAYGTQKHEIEVYDGEVKKLLQKYESGRVDEMNPNHINRIFSLRSLKNDPNLFFTGGWDNTVRLWDIRVKDVYVRKFSGPSISADSLDLKNNVLLSGNYSNKDTVQLWDFNSGSLIKSLDLKEQENGSFYCFSAAFAHKSNYNLLGAGISGLNKVKVYENDEIITELKFQGAPLCLSFYQFNGKDFMLASGIEGTIYVIKLKIIKPQ